MITFRQGFSNFFEGDQLMIAKNALCTGTKVSVDEKLVLSSPCQKLNSRFSKRLISVGILSGIVYIPAQSRLKIIGGPRQN